MTKILKYLILLIVASQFVGVVFAQSTETFIIEGTVESETGKPIEDAKIKVMDLGSDLIDSTTTDIAGFYQLEMAVLTDVEKIKEIPNTISLSQNYPNPFSENTNISFSTEKEGNVYLSIDNQQPNNIKKIVVQLWR